MKYFSVLKNTLRGRLLALTFEVAIAYLTLSLYAINASIIITTIVGDYSLDYKLRLLSSILIGSWSLYMPIEAMLMIVIGILMGINISLMVKIFRTLQANKGLRVTFGGSSVLAIVSAGCPACGISLLSLVGISIPLLPIQGASLQLFAVILLLASIVYSLRKLQQPIVCEIPSDGGTKQPHN